MLEKMQEIGVILVQKQAGVFAYGLKQADGSGLSNVQKLNWISRGSSNEAQRGQQYTLVPRENELTLNRDLNMCA